MRARFDGVCIKGCGKRIVGWQTSPSEPCSDIGWRRRGETYGLDSVAWHTECSHLPDNMAIIAELQAKKALHPTPYRPVAYRPAPKSIVMGADGIAHLAPEYPIESKPIPAPLENESTMTPEQVAAMIQSAVSAAMSGTPAITATIPAPIKAPKAITIKSNWWEKLEAVIACGMTRVLLVGPPGTGKSTTADRDGLRVTCHEDAGPESMIGTFIQKDGNTIWIDGPSVIAMKEGKRIVKDELDHTSPECVSLMYATLDDAPSIMLPTGEYVKAAKGYQVICTSNASPMDLPDAILDRIECVIVADIPHTNAVASIKAGTDSDSLVSLMHNYYRGLSKDAYRWKGQPTLRRIRNFGKLLSAGLNKEVAAECVFGNSYKEVLSALTTSAVR